MDKTGDTLWTQETSESHDYLWDILPMQDGRFMSGGSRCSKDCDEFIRVTDAGRIVSEDARTLNAENEEFTIEKLTPLSDGNYAVLSTKYVSQHYSDSRTTYFSGSREVDSTTPDSIKVTKITPEGAFLWSNRFSYPHDCLFRQIIGLGNNACLIVGRKEKSRNIRDYPVEYNCSLVVIKFDTR
jgi:hypothetical protein